jgi:hypothetical protein
MSINTMFDASNLFRIEAVLLAHPIAQSYFQGNLYDGSGQRLTMLSIARGQDTTMQLDAVSTGRLFMIPDGSIVTVARVNEHADTPAGVDIRSNNIFLADDEQNSVVVYRSADGPAMWIDALYIRNVMLAPHAPRRLISVGFGLMAIAAYRLGFKQISLFAAGCGPLPTDYADTMVGYMVWPKFGFDAQVVPVELDRFPNRALLRAATIQDVRSAAPGWWEEHGSGRTMYFDLTAGSRSWSLLLNYLHTALLEDAT